MLRKLAQCVGGVHRHPRILFKPEMPVQLAILGRVGRLPHQLIPLLRSGIQPSRAIPAVRNFTEKGIVFDADASIIRRICQQIFIAGQPHLGVQPIGHNQLFHHGAGDETPVHVVISAVPLAPRTDETHLERVDGMLPFGDDWGELVDMPQNNCLRRVVQGVGHGVGIDEARLYFHSPGNQRVEIGFDGS